MINFDWSDGSRIWQNTHPHNNEATLVKQCEMVKAHNTGTKCFVYRNTELALQWQESSRAAMTQPNVDNNWFLKFKTKEQCEAAAPCNIAAYNNANNPNVPPIPCNKTAPISVPNCAYCCNFSAGSTGAYNEPIGGGKAIPGKPTPTRFGDNALGDGQFFWDYRNPHVQDYWANEVVLAGVQSPFVDGMFTDDPSGFGQEHPVLQSVVQLTQTEIVAIQRGTQLAWMKALALVTREKKYFAQAFRIPPSFNTSVQSNTAACTAWMREQCAVPANESTLVFDGVPGWKTVSAGTSEASVNMTMAAFLVVRGPYSFVAAPYELIQGRDWNNPFFRIYKLDTGTPISSCEEAPPNIFSRRWSGGKVSIACTTTTSSLDFNLLSRF